MTPHNRNLMAPDLAGVADWFTSSYSNGGGNCVEAADLIQTTYGAVALRDSKDPAGPALLFPSDAFASFVADVREGRFDG
ncbi:DUF397 domain-containing protein [Streptomyces sp. N2-109]|uniref:DUF397 domain-containing protein n=1 Tax=Streptomyces gossypii TaxID=2883101 RepID=A0ABT2JZP3_9ACTN|nr:DUF397 domain-containing protein [Streptomyces gossypii]MCT2593326.1 DUF397 domain-containing protein [Streptomyces gossypii]